MREQYDYIAACPWRCDVDRINATIKRNGTVVPNTQDTYGNGAVHRLEFDLTAITEDLARALRELLDDIRHAEYAGLDTGSVSITDMPAWQEILGRHGLATFAVHEARNKSSEEVWQESVASSNSFRTGKFVDHPREKIRAGHEYDARWRKAHPEEHGDGIEG